MTIICPECAAARVKRWHGIYRSGCLGCQARAVARSHWAMDAVRTRRTAELREVLATAMPMTSAEDALRQVWSWWRNDHPEKIQSEGTPA